MHRQQTPPTSLSHGSEFYVGKWHACLQQRGTTLQMFLLLSLCQSQQPVKIKIGEILAAA